MHSRITKLHACPDCGSTTDGKSCRCGWAKRNRSSKPTRVWPACKLCNMPGEYSGYCKMHWDKKAEDEHIKTLERYLKTSTGRQREAIENMISLTKYNKLAHQVQEKQEEGDDINN